MNQFRPTRFEVLPTIVKNLLIIKIYFRTSGLNELSIFVFQTRWPGPCKIVIHMLKSIGFTLVQDRICVPYRSRMPLHHEKNCGRIREQVTRI